ncbi:MAG TPA: acyl-CoA dehydrogenase family protein [Ilumatobacter sp.]|nr:acyl-CoA dehydrogenase family protein [Ilumatobacter sp.]
MKRTLYDGTHEAFRDTCRRFVEREIVPHVDEWERAGIVDRAIYRRAGEIGLLGIAVPDEYGGGGSADFRFNAVLNEEFTRAAAGGAALGFCLHNDIVTPYFVEYCNDEQRSRWLPGIADGTLITAIAMTEPGYGSDLAGMSTTARRDGADYVVNGSKTFITNGINSDLIIVAAKTEPSAGRQGISLLVVERGMPGFERGRNLEKVGQHSQDTAELFFDDVRVPAANLLGEENAGFGYLSFNLAQERLSIAITGVAAARAALAWTVDYVESRTVFGRPVGAFQNSKFVLAQVATEIEVAQAYVDKCIDALNAGELTPVDAAMAKLWCTELQQRTVDRCLQLFGAYGYMLEYPIARAYADARITTIYGGTSEIMKTIIAKSLLAG